MLQNSLQHENALQHENGEDYDYRRVAVRPSNVRPETKIALSVKN